MYGIKANIGVLMWCYHGNMGIVSNFSIDLIFKYYIVYTNKTIRYKGKFIGM